MEEQNLTVSRKQRFFLHAEHNFNIYGRARSTIAHAHAQNSSLLRNVHCQRMIRLRYFYFEFSNAYCEHDFMALKNNNVYNMRC